MNESKLQHFAKNMFKIGTPECAIFSAIAAMVLALLILLVGFWNTMLVALLMLLGAFVGGVKDKKQWIKDKINLFFPAPHTVPYREDNEAIARAVREATGMRAKEAPQEDPEASDTPEE